MTEETVFTLGNCRLCNYQSDLRLMMNVFEESTAYGEKIENYLNLKLFPADDKTPTCICFHCSQTLDNFHNFATKIQQIQKIIYPQLQENEIAYEICVIPCTSDEIQKHEEVQKTYKVTTIRTRSQKVQEKVFDELKIDHENLSNRSFDFEENVEMYEVTNVSDEEIPARDVENSDWPSSETLKKIPTKLIENGLLLYKGKKLMQMMSSFYNLTCEVCDGKFRRITDLFEHYKAQHSVDPFVTCCSSKLSKMPRIIWHFVKHIQPESFKCKICSYVVSRPKFLELHLQTHTNSKPFSCDLCNKRFIWKGALKSHLINHQPESERKSYICSVCSRKYQTAGSLASHKKSAHGNVVKSRNLCEKCCKSFSTLTSYKEHMITHSEDSEKLQLKCPECDKWLKNQRCLKSHMQLHTNVDLKCEMCDYVTKKAKLLKNHVITRHSNDRPWSCDACDKSFKVKRALTIHKAQNHAENGRKTGKTCEFCFREFASSTNYYTHRKNLHAAELQQIIDKKKEDEKMKRIEIGLE